MALLLRPPGCTEVPARSPDCNVAAYLDAWLLGRKHLYAYPSCRCADPPCAYLDPEVRYEMEDFHVTSAVCCCGLWPVLLNLDFP